MADRARTNPNWLTDDALALTLDATGPVILAHVSPQPGGKSVLEVLDLTPWHKTIVGARSDTTGTGTNTPDHNEGLGGLPLELIRELIAGDIAGTPLGEGRWTSDHHVVQPLGSWTGPSDYIRSMARALS